MLNKYYAYVIITTVFIWIPMLTIGCALSYWYDDAKYFNIFEWHTSLICAFGLWTILIHGAIIEVGLDW